MNDMSEYQRFARKGILTPAQLPRTQSIACHFALGLSGEAGEVVDIIKKNVFHDNPLDKNHLTEELGDVLWYLANIASLYSIDLEEVMQRNEQKLRERYAEQYAHVEKEAVKLLNAHCTKCGSSHFKLRKNGPHIEARCASCGAYYKMLSKKQMLLTQKEVDKYVESEDDVPWD